jgi:lysophospholipase L1-like esterase
VKSFETFSWAISQAAKAYHVPVADVYRAFNGKSHREDPVAKGYIKADGIHPNNRGRAVIAKTIAALGYRKVAPPS